MDRTAMGAPEQSSSIVEQPSTSPEHVKTPAASKRRIWWVRGGFSLVLLAATVAAGMLAVR
jgi:hypothetical protein